MCQSGNDVFPFGKALHVVENELCLVGDSLIQVKDAVILLGNDMLLCRVESVPVRV